MGYYRAGGYYMAGQEDTDLSSLIDEASLSLGSDGSADVMPGGTDIQQVGAVKDLVRKGLGMAKSKKLGSKALHALAGVGAAPARHHRRMNPFNPRALMRANRRLHSFVKHATRFYTFTKHHRFKKKGRRR